MPELEERIAKLEATQDFMRAQISEMSDNVKEMHSILLQAKGARWAILGVAGFAGLLASKIGWLVTAFGYKM